LFLLYNFLLAKITTFEDIFNLPPIWRVIKSPPASAEYNMALDEAFLFSTSQFLSPPTLRLYSWHPPAISIGYAQKINDVDPSALAKNQWGLVRRPTGGKAILHIDELTYSITAPLNDPIMAGSLLESYRRISAALQKSLEFLGISTSADHQYSNESGQKNIDAVCFKTPSNYEITWKGKKLIGSAQARKAGGVLQHGSLPLFGDLARITKVLNYASQNDRDTAAQQTLDRAVTLEEAAGHPITWEQVSEALIAGFSSQFGIQLMLDEPTQNELAEAEKLVQTKYASSSWTNRI